MRLLTILVAVGHLTFGLSQKVLKPTNIELLDFSPEKEKAFNSEESLKKCEAVWKKMEQDNLDFDQLSQQDKDALSNCDEMRSSIWSIEGDGCSWYCGGGYDSLWASSELASQGKSDYKVENIHDGSAKNAWVEGKKGYGIGEKISFRFKDESPRVTSIQIVNGYVKSKSAYQNNSRVKKFKVWVDDRVLGIFELEDKISKQSFTVDPLGRFGKKEHWILTFEIMEVYKGLKWDDVVVTEIYFDGLDVHCLAGDGYSKVMTSKKEWENIEDLKIGDQILSLNTLTGEVEKDKILELASVKHCGLIKIVTKSGLEIRCTKDHPFVDADGEWMSFDPKKSNTSYILSKVNQLTIGTILKTSRGPDEILSIEELPGQTQTYTIVKLKKGNAFNVNGVWVGTEELRIE